LTVQLEKSCPRLNRRHHPLGKLWGDLQTTHQINDEFVVVPDGNDQAYQRTRSVTVARRKPQAEATPLSRLVHSQTRFELA